MVPVLRIGVLGVKHLGRAPQGPPKWVFEEDPKTVPKNWNLAAPTDDIYWP